MTCTFFNIASYQVMCIANVVPHKRSAADHHIERATRVAAKVISSPVKPGWAHLKKIKLPLVPRAFVREVLFPRMGKVGRGLRR